MAYTPTLWAKGDIVTSEKLNKIEQGIVDKVDKVDGKTLSTNDFTNEDKAKLDGLESQIDHLESLVGSPLVASTAAEMTDDDKVYVYTGSETGYQSGNWYYYNGTSWVSGGVYNSVAFETDDTLSTQGMAADAKKTGDEISALKEDLDNNVDELAYQDEKIGDIELANGSMSLSKTYNGINGNIGQEINITTTNSYFYIVTPLTGLNRVSIQTNVGTSATYPYYAYITDENDEIIDRILPKHDASSGDGYDTAVLTVKPNYKKLYVLCYGKNKNATITDNAPYALQKQIKSINHFFAEKDVVKMTNDALSDASVQNATINGLTFAFVTDTHSNGVFVSADRQTTYTGLDSAMTNTAFKQLINNGMVDCGVHCGDIISAYNITNSDYIKTVAEKLHDYTDLDKPVFFVKGNHECNAEEGLHESTDVITPAQYYFAVQKISDTRKNFDEQNPFGGYYYTDFEQYKVRLIMLNCYIDPITNGITTEFGSRQLQWFYSVALDLSTKSPDWGVIVFSHTGASSSAIRRVIQAFINKGVEYTYNNISYQFDDDSNGYFIALIHGHTHTDEYSDTYGYNNIGVDRGYAQTSQSGNDRCCVDLFTVIPSTNYSHSSGVLYENRVGRGSSRSYNYGATVGLITN